MRRVILGLPPKTDTPIPNGVSPARAMASAASSTSAIPRIGAKISLRQRSSSSVPRGSNTSRGSASPAAGDAAHDQPTAGGEGRRARGLGDVWSVEVAGEVGRRVLRVTDHNPAAYGVHEARAQVGPTAIGGTRMRLAEAHCPAFAKRRAAMRPAAAASRRPGRTISASLPIGLGM